HFILHIHHTLQSTLFPYTTLFRSRENIGADQHNNLRADSKDNGVLPRLLKTGTLQDAAEIFQPSIMKLSAADARIAERIINRQRSEEHTSELQSPDHLVCRLLLEK